MDFSLILNHPEVDQIVSKLLTGTSGKTVYDWLQLKYPNDNQSHLRISCKLLQEFQNSPYLDYYKQVEQDLQKIQNNQPIDKKISASLLNNKTYKERLNEAADEKIESAQMLKQAHVIFLTRLEQIFDKIQENPSEIRRDTENALLKYLELWMNFIEKYEKVVNNKPDQVIQHNYLITYYDQYIELMRQTIIDVCQEVDPSMAFLFMEKFNEKNAKLQAPELSKPENISEKKLIEEAKLLQNKLIEIEK